MAEAARRELQICCQASLFQEPAVFARRRCWPSSWRACSTLIPKRRLVKSLNCIPRQSHCHSQCHILLFHFRRERDGSWVLRKSRQRYATLYTGDPAHKADSVRCDSLRAVVIVTPGPARACPRQSAYSLSTIMIMVSQSYHILPSSSKTLSWASMGRAWARARQPIVQIFEAPLPLYHHWLTMVNGWYNITYHC